MTDEREHLPSASGMERLFPPDGCPGSFQLEAHLSDPSNRAPAARGERIHAAMEGKLPVERLSHSDRICYERLAFEEGRLVEELGFEGATQFKEQRLWYKSGERRLFSGKPDVIHVLSNRALVVNFKTGFFPSTPIKHNRQMLCEGVLVAASGNWQFDHIVVALIHPNCALEDGKISQYVRHSIIDLQRASRLFEKAVEDALDPDAPRVPSAKACLWCLGRKNKCCQEFLTSGLKL